MTEGIIPPDLTLTELSCVNWVLSRIKHEILEGRPSGQVIDQALEEVMNLAAGD